MYLRKLKIALAFLLICLVVLISASYAWLTMSRAPQIAGIDTRIGANGSLEIALLSDSTYMDPSLIRASVGDSAVVQDPTVSNLSWGNVVDLSDESYGLSRISMLPTRLNLSSGGDGRSVVSSNMLIIPGYGLDGRFSKFDYDTVSATFVESDFTYFTDNQSYGVRGIGTISNMTPQQSALAGARSLVQSYASACTSAAASAWQANGDKILDIYCRKYYMGAESFDNSDVAVIRDTATRMLGSLSYIDLALRQGVIGYAASVIGDTDTFKTLRSTVENTAIPVSLIADMIPAELPSGFSGWISTVESGKRAMQSVIASCDALQGGSYSWTQVSSILIKLMDPTRIYLGQDSLTTEAAYASLTADNVLTVLPDAGVMADVADFAGNYNVFFQFLDTASVEVTTASAASPAYLAQISAILTGCSAAAGDGNLTDAALNDIYGYAVDMAFRCNTASDLLLQTQAALRVEEDAETPQTQGGGSYMRFASEQLDTDHIIRMMDAVRIAFIDNQNVLLGVAKLNTSNYTVTDEGVSAPLYLYDYTISRDGSISVGERQGEQATVASLPESIATVITAVVWLDGDHVDNSLATITGQSMTGTLNLQFASSASLLPSDLPIKGTD